jgi:D-glycero-alpha-D-manno-heptose 1-phosphate guanylyltransferase
MNSQTCIVLAGGLGTRLRSAVGDVPKCMAPVGPRPFIDIQIDALLAAGVGEVVLSLGHGASQVVSGLAATFASKPVRHVTEPGALGTGGAVAFVMDSLGLTEALVANGDTFLSGDLRAMLRPLDVAGGELFRMALVEVGQCGRFGAVQVAEYGTVQAFREKGYDGPGRINAGLYRVRREALPRERAGAYSLEVDVLPGLVDQGAVRAVLIDGTFTDIGVPEDYFRFRAEHAG